MVSSFCLCQNNKIKLIQYNVGLIRTYRIIRNGKPSDIITRQKIALMTFERIKNVR